jgi:hypothetical protein
VAARPPQAWGWRSATPSGGRVKRGHLCGSPGGRAPPLMADLGVAAPPLIYLGVAARHPGCHRGGRVLRGHHWGWLERHPQLWGGPRATPEVAGGGARPPPWARGGGEPPPAASGGGSQATPSTSNGWLPTGSHPEFLFFFFFFFFLKKKKKKIDFLASEGIFEHLGKKKSRARDLTSVQNNRKNGRRVLFADVGYFKGVECHFLNIGG